MKTTYEMLLEIKKYPQLFIKNKHFTNLMLYIDGYNKCLIELFGGKTNSFVYSIDFVSYVFKYFSSNDNIHNWKQIILLENDNEEDAFDSFYSIMESYLSINPKAMIDEHQTQEKFHKFQLNLDMEKTPVDDTYSTTYNLYEYLKKIDDPFLKHYAKKGK